MSRTVLAILVILVIAGGVRVYGLDWGLPHLYEEATPLKKAWDMWGFERDGFDANPHFFNYPTLAIYLQLGTQAGMYAGMKASGVIDDTIDFRAIYRLEPTPLVLAGRSLTALLGVLTVLAVFLLARSAGGIAAGLLAMSALALNPVHMAKCQVIEVDVPLTLFSTLTLWGLVRCLGDPRPRRLILAGVFLGLALSTKYTAAVLLAPVVAAAAVDLLGGKRDQRPRNPVRWLLVPGVGLLVFLATSPYIVLDFASFTRDLAMEREHMRLGHFGIESGGSWLYYFRILGHPLAGWPAWILALGGTAWLGVVRRRGDVLVLATFLLVYYLAVGSLAMKAVRYALPLLPVVLVLAAITADALITRWGKRVSLPGGRGALWAVVAILVVAPPLAGLPAHLNRLQPDTRTRAREWIHASIPPGSLLAMEAYGPELLTPIEFLPMEPALRQKALEGADRWPLYGLWQIPMFQVTPERSAAFYDLNQYALVDYVVVTSLVRSRYEADPIRFPRQNEFYEQLAREFPLKQVVSPDGGTGPVIEIYANPAQVVPFAQREGVRGPVPLRVTADALSGEEGYFYYNLGLNYECWDFVDAAMAAYASGLSFSNRRPGVYLNLVYGGIRCLSRTGKGSQTYEFLEQAQRYAETEADRRILEKLKLQIRRN